MTTPTAEPKIDPDTGLPELPEGYVWEIARNPQNKRLVNLMIRMQATSHRKVRVGWFKYELEEYDYLIHTNYYEAVTPSSVPYYAEKLLRRFMDDKRDAEKMDEIIGLYPPKKFNSL